MRHTRRTLFLFTSFAAAAAWSCAAGAPAALDDSSDDSSTTAGAAGTAGAGTAGASTAGAAGAGSAGSAGAAATNSGLVIGSGGPHPFPSTKKPAYCSITSSTSASAAVTSAYSSWKSAYVTSNGAGGNLRVQDPQGSNRTVSEGIGYGMIAAVYMADRATFDGLWKYAQAHFDTTGLMNWEISSGGTTTSGGSGSATDADEDMAWALIQASDQWNDASYATAATKMLSAMLATEIAANGTLKPGDQWGGTTLTYPDYFSPAYFRVFAKLTGSTVWATAILDRNYTILGTVTGSNGLVPDQIDASTSAATKPNYGYDACRTPWRIGMDYCFNNEARAKAYIDKVAAFFNSQGNASDIRSGYTTSGSPYNSDPANMAFIGPAGVSGMAGQQALLDGAFNFGASGTGGQQVYFAQSLRVVTMLMMSGNFVDFTGP